MRYLTPRERIHIFTKASVWESSSKLENSGSSFFPHCKVRFIFIYRIGNSKFNISGTVRYLSLCLYLRTL